MAKNIEIGKKYKINEDIRMIVDMATGQYRPPIIAGTECEVVEYDKEHHPYVTVRFNGGTLRTEDHMLDEI